MNNKINCINDEIPAYKKKSKKKGLPRANHKHIYETVLLNRVLNYSHLGVIHHEYPTQVCMICGYIGDLDKNETYYDIKRTSEGHFPIIEKSLSEKALNLPKWHVDDWGKFAIKTEEESV